jgi:carboxymethylenebutenolidase
MATMIDAPYVNHIPTTTDSVGHDQLKSFYKYFCVGANPPDSKLVRISRTVGTDSLVDEMLFSVTDAREIDWILPGVPPTGRKV